MDTASAPKVFISYRRLENPADAGWLHEAMVTRFGESNVFMDLEMKPGENFVERITAVLDACYVLLVVIGPRWATPPEGGSRARLRDPDDLVRREVEIALRREDVTVIPVLVAGARMPDVAELPKSLHDLTELQALELSYARRSYDIARLVSRLEEVLAETTGIDDVPSVQDDPARQQSGAADGSKRAAGRPMWWFVAATAAAVVALVTVLIATGAPDRDRPQGEVTYAASWIVRDLDARAAKVVLTHAADGGGGSVLSGLDQSNGTFEDLDRTGAHYNGIDVGTDPQGHDVFVASRCAARDSCDVYRGPFDREAVRVELSTGACTAVRPSIARGDILFSRDGPNCDLPGLYLKRRARSMPERITGDTHGADFSGPLAAWRVNSRTLAVATITEVGVKEQSRAAAVGEHSFLAPLVLDGDYLYFVDEVGSGAGSSFWIARVRVPLEKPSLERYVPRGDTGPAPSAPRFGVASGVLYRAGYPRPGGGDGNRVIVRDDEPDFRPIDGALR